MDSEQIMARLEALGAVIRGSHLVLTSGNHSTGYVDMRQIAHDPAFLLDLGASLGLQLARYKPDMVIGPETLGRSLAMGAAQTCGNGYAIWCDMIKGSPDRAVFSSKLPFEQMVEGKKLAVVDDLLSTGHSIRQVANLVGIWRGTVVAAGAVINRTPGLTAIDCGVQHLETLITLDGFQILSPEDCASHGPCSQGVPMRLRPGHGYDWIIGNSGYPVAE